MNDDVLATPVNRYAADPAWLTVDAYFAAALVNEDAVLVKARESGAQTTMPNAEVAANQGALLGLLAQIQGARRILEFGTPGRILHDLPGAGSWRKRPGRDIGTGSAECGCGKRES